MSQILCVKSEPLKILPNIFGLISVLILIVCAVVVCAISLFSSSTPQSIALESITAENQRAIQELSYIQSESDEMIISPIQDTIQKKVTTVSDSILIGSHRMFLSDGCKEIEESKPPCELFSAHVQNNEFVMYSASLVKDIGLPRITSITFQSFDKKQQTVTLNVFAYKSVIASYQIHLPDKKATLISP